jgi:hypothetical protein
MFEIREVQDRVSKGGMFAHDSTIRLIFGYVKYIITKTLGKRLVTEVILGERIWGVFGGAERGW